MTGGHRGADPGMHRRCLDRRSGGRDRQEGSGACLIAKGLCPRCFGPDGPSLSALALLPAVALTRPSAAGGAISHRGGSAGLGSISAVRTTDSISHSYREPSANGLAAGDAPAILKWSQPSKIDNPQDAPDAVSCASATFCVAVDQRGNAVTYDGQFWGTPQSIDPPHQYRVDGQQRIGGGYLHAVSCVSSTFCVAVDSNFALVFNGSAWSQPELIDPGASLNAISCPVEGFCAATDGNGAVYFLQGSTWSDQGDIDPSAVDVSCASATFCMVVDGNTDAPGGSRIYENGSWQPRIIDGKHGGPISISCLASTFCMGAVPGGHTFIYQGEKWKPLGVVGPTFVACSSNVDCEGVDPNGSAYRFNGKSWSSAQQIDTNPLGSPYLSAISCAPESFCETTDDEGNAVSFKNGSWSSPTVIDAEVPPLQSISCPATHFCVAIDGQSSLVFDGTAWTKEPLQNRSRCYFLCVDHVLRGGWFRRGERLQRKGLDLTGTR